jgi:hypothetical protein
MPPLIPAGESHRAKPFSNGDGCLSPQQSVSMGVCDNPVLFSIGPILIVQHRWQYYFRLSVALHFLWDRKERWRDGFGTAFSFFTARIKNYFPLPSFIYMSIKTNCTLPVGYSQLYWTKRAGVQYFAKKDESTGYKAITVHEAKKRFYE